MRGNRIITKLTSLVLILVFSQKMGMSLFLHNWLHASKQHASSSKPISSQELQLACGCINDFNLPLAETSIPEIQAPVIIMHKPHTEPVFVIPAVNKYFHSLRAPPQLI